MRQFAITFSSFNGKSSIHAINCPSVKAAKSRRLHVAVVDATHVELAATSFSQEIADSDWPQPIACRCTRKTVGC